jgi:hypothetical protein
VRLLLMLSVSGLAAATNFETILVRWLASFVVAAPALSALLALVKEIVP